MKSKRKVLLALTINKHYFIRGVVRYAREHDWYLVTDMMYTGRVPLGWRGDGILTILGYRKELADFIKSAGVPTVAITLVNDEILRRASRGQCEDAGRRALSGTGLPAFRRRPFTMSWTASGTKALPAGWRNGALPVTSSPRLTL